MRTNVRQKAVHPVTHEGAPGPALTPVQQLRRTVLTCMLFEDNFYENGQSVADRIGILVPQVDFDTLAEIAIDAREKQKLRHVPLLIARHALKHFHGRKVGDLIARIIQRPDEAGELLSLYWQEKPGAPLAAQLKLGLARAIQKFDAYSLAKNDRASAAVKLRDVIFLTHPRARNDEVGKNFALLVNKTFVPPMVAEAYGLPADKVGLPSPETWENRLSRGEDKRATFEAMIAEGKLGALAMLRNLRNMIEAGVPDAVIRQGLLDMKAERVLPFRFLTAARYAVRFEPELEKGMLRCTEGMPKLAGRTAILVDTSGSMNWAISSKSEVKRVDAAAGLAVLVREVAEHARVFVFTEHFAEVEPRRGFALRDAISNKLPPGGTMLGQAVQKVAKAGEFDRLIVITDEQSHDAVNAPMNIARRYMINVAGYEHGVGFGPWMRVEGWSEAILDYIQALEAAEEEAA